MIKKLVVCLDLDYGEEFESLVINKELKFPYKYFTDNISQEILYDRFTIGYRIFDVLEIDTDRMWTIKKDNSYNGCTYEIKYLDLQDKELNYYDDEDKEYYQTY